MHAFRFSVFLIYGRTRTSLNQRGAGCLRRLAQATHPFIILNNTARAASWAQGGGVGGAPRLLFSIINKSRGDACKPCFHTCFHESCAGSYAGSDGIHAPRRGRNLVSIHVFMSLGQDPTRDPTGSTLHVAGGYCFHTCFS